MASNKKYWKSVEELNENSSIVETLRDNEFVEEIPTDEFLGDKDKLSSSSTTRRDFLKYVGFSTAAATLAACEGPVVKSIPYVVQPDEIVPGVADYYATTVADGFDFVNVLVKTREGRPIKIDNNKLAGAYSGANARVNASVLTMYDSLRLKQPKVSGKDTTWDDVDVKVKASLEDAKSKGGNIVLLTNTMASPSTDKLIGEFVAAYPTAKHVVYDAVSSSSALDAYEKAYGTRGLADYDFSQADVIVSVDADFLGDWQGGGYDSAYAQKRIPKRNTDERKVMSKHIQLESNMSLSGANADVRLPLNSADLKAALVKIYNIVVGANVSTNGTAYDEAIKKAAQQLKAAGSNGVLVSGIDDVNAQLLVFAINEALGSKAFLPEQTKFVRQGNDAAVAQLIKDMTAGKVHTLIMSNVNPVYSLANGEAFAEALKNVDLSVDFSMKEDETALVSTIAAAAPHYLESWGDVVIKKGHYSVTQPTIRPLFDTRQFQDALLLWTNNNTPYYDYVKSVGQATISNKTWNKIVHDGFATFGDLNKVSANADFTSAANAVAKAKKEGDFELVFYTKTGMGDGQQANNPWLQEFPDPISRASWDNYATVARVDAEALGIVNKHVANGGLDGSYITLTVNGVTLENVPALIQPGQAPGTIGLAFGYGRKEALKKDMQVGVNAYKLYFNANKVQTVSVAKGNGMHEFACVQLHNTLMSRNDIIKETTADVFNANTEEWNVFPMVSYDHQNVKARTIDIWESFDRTVGHHFNLSIDLNACTGCGACVIACHAENNVPVVGKSEVRRSRDMHWLRIDRYYSSEDTFDGDVQKKKDAKGLSEYRSAFYDLENPADNPQVAFQPVMCQHCNHAPCETVCPVAATSHGRQGQNHMAYNRCVGTRYCANNCPYKVRRFNWFLYSQNNEFDFNMNDDLGRMVLNPDVVVRSRGVMEKCSLCIQMTQATILKAKNEGRAVRPNEFETACSAACSSGAMVFGDVNDKDSDIVELVESDRSYHLLEHIGTKPNVVYHVKVRNV
ncbi:MULTISPECIES: TAT-variant-translocated molybdopterin oxidoreductase [Myroides]|uniref:4Fe-4S dicluster domain-containing protein n=1 Tax=Myroides albus TaxID=2562892 RepID=A0A6I3LL12_9FLAO|nr:MULTISPECIES: TAT-variant-translocated molybdopterin oxidoreductase [Myroides]MTG96852.1 4Fe-4S dicluster domain-containing protein [Myroides albus]MVX36957.1 TAT-variant-translocated molybdopterin oxidoreductase [Myroides sp. LoEW2-1]UVD78398.1 TAT-variant-translocated molybdopterin oxidoreductase [Myroides albus]